MDLFNKSELESIGKYLLDNKETISIAESVTSGLLQFAFSNIPNAIQFFQGGITAYNIAQKYKHLHIEPIHALAVNCVSPAVAEEMAINVCETFKSHWGISITGYATPVPESGNSLYAYYAIAYKKTIKLSGEIKPAPDTPKATQLLYASTVLRKLGASFN